MAKNSHQNYRQSQKGPCSAAVEIVAKMAPPSTVLYDNQSQPNDSSSVLSTDSCCPLTGRETVSYLSYQAALSNASPKATAQFLGTLGRGRFRFPEQVGENLATECADVSQRGGMNDGKRVVDVLHTNILVVLLSEGVDLR